MSLQKITYIGKRIINHTELVYTYLNKDEDRLFFSKPRSKPTGIGSIIEVEINGDTCGKGNVLKDIIATSEQIGKWKAESESSDLVYKARKNYKQTPSNTLDENIRALRKLQRGMGQAQKHALALKVYLELTKY